ncbi:DoxX family protein [Streptomyces massasporeus]
MSKRLMTGLYWFLALEFALGAVTKFWPGDTMFSSAYATKFVDWGYPPWMRFVVGALEGIAAVLLVISRPSRPRNWRPSRRRPTRCGSSRPRTTGLAST